MSFIEDLQGLLGKERVKCGELMAGHTTFRIGGEAEYYVAPTEEEVPKVIELCKLNKVPVTFIGNGSNLLVGDLGIKGLVIELGDGMADFAVNAENGEVYAQAGAMLVAVANKAAAEGLTGMEFASGIPGTIGGGLVMNAGAYGGELKDILKEITVLTEDGRVVTYDVNAYEGNYRTSRPMREHEIVLHAVFGLKKGDPEKIRERMRELKEQRTSKQPLELPSAGSTFKRPEGHFAGKLIMDAGLSGYSVGGAQVSEKHCGFVVNKGGASAQDVRMLIDAVRDRVKEHFGVELEPEIRFVGDFR